LHDIYIYLCTFILNIYHVFETSYIRQLNSKYRSMLYKYKNTSNFR